MQGRPEDILPAGGTEPAASLTGAERDVLGRAGHPLSGPAIDFLIGLKTSQRHMVVMRLDAILGLDAGLTPERASQKVAVSTSTLYRLKKRWDEERHLRVLAGAATRPPRGTGTAANLEEARRVAGEVVRQPGAAALSINALAVSVRESTPSGVSLKAAEAIVREARRQLLLEARDLPEDYGRLLLLDCFAISLRLKGTRQDELALLSVVLEGATGLILSAEVSERRRSARAQVIALRKAHRFIRNARIDRTGVETELLAIAPPTAAVHQEEYVSRLERAIGADRVVKKGAGRFGRQAIRRIGRRLGPIHIIPRATDHGTADAASVSASGREAVSRRLADRIIEDAIYRHNASILRILEGARNDTVGDVAEGHGSMRRILDRILIDLSPDG